MEVSRRDWLAAATFAGLVPGMALAQEEEAAQEKPAAPKTTAKAVAKEAPAPGALTEETLKKLLEANGLKPTQNQSRFDFAFALKPPMGEEWNLSMSAVLSADAKTIWVMAWLDELPRSSRDVPRTALLRLLAENDLMGKGKFFSYIPTNRRFALQQVIENHSMTSQKFRSTLVDLGHTVMETYSFWSVEAWKDPATADSANADPAGGQQPAESNSNTAKQPATQTARPTSTQTKKTTATPATIRK